MAKQREERREIKSVVTATMNIVLGEGQYFCETGAAYEIWQEEPLQRVKRIEKRRVFWVEVY